MAGLRQDEKSAQKKESAGEKTAEQTRQAGEEVAQASTHLLQQNLELLQNSCRFGVEVATAMMGHSTPCSDVIGRSGSALLPVGSSKPTRSRTADTC
ncbi:hypothetical protein [Bradyrhizobium sp. 191]|uniref:hypothetical protein n=1 Tax=Bradyrhizobium sp. 191 TaxID=2782659 RepID=UPI001FFF72CF|nr:hypothetical protein [Bradyrhizobium sp. 191]UPJ68283.1 hypothetical protein IVB23_13590 [Bradyrhizobium sp. 191]